MGHFFYLYMAFLLKRFQKFQKNNFTFILSTKIESHEKLFFFKKTTLLIVVFSITLQSCSIYKSTPISLDEAVSLNSKVRLETFDHHKFILKKIEKRDSIYYGVKSINGNLVSIPLKQKEVKSIRVTNKPASVMVSIGVGTASLGILGLLVFAATYKDDLKDTKGN